MVPVVARVRRIRKLACTVGLAVAGAQRPRLALTKTRRIRRAVGIVAGPIRANKRLVRRNKQRFYSAVLGPRHRDTLYLLGVLATLYRDQGRYGEAEPLFRKALQEGKEVAAVRKDTAWTSGGWE
jgi:hypothetical protein